MALKRVKQVVLDDHVSIKLGQLEPREYFGTPNDRVRIFLDEAQNRIYLERDGERVSVHEAKTKRIVWFRDGELEAVLAKEKAEEAAKPKAATP